MKQFFQKKGPSKGRQWHERKNEVEQKHQAALTPNLPSAKHKLPATKFITMWYGSCVHGWVPREMLTCWPKADKQQHSEDQQTYSPLGLYGFKYI